MKKNLITTAIISCAAITSFSAAASGPQFYGRADLALTNADNQYATNNQKEGTVLENNFSWLGVKGTEKVNEHVEIIYQMEFGVTNFDNSGNTFSARNSFVGAKTDYGTVVVGRNDTVFKASEGGVDLFGNTNSDIDRMAAGQNREADGVTYYSPKIADLITLNATYLMDDNHVDADGNSKSDDTMYAVSATLGDRALRAQNYYFAAAYQDGIGDIEAFRAVGQAKFGDVIVGAMYQNSESTDEKLSHIKGDTFFVNAAYVIGDWKLKAMYGQDDSGLGHYAKRFANDNGAHEDMTDFDLKQFSVGADYKLSKNAMLYGHYTKYDGDMTLETVKHDISDDIFTVGLRLNF
ncbi:porin [Shewanella maritima]|uniref:porin n=1 Tax=Shewanella maritima TaxID=2520507 RepID=UPI0037368ED0